MKRSSSAPSLTTVHISKPLKRCSTSCHALNLMIQPVEYNSIILAKVPFTQVYQCNQSAPKLTASTDEKDLATCLATPPDPVEKEEITARFARNECINMTMSRYQLWWERIKRQRDLSIKTNNYMKS